MRCAINGGVVRVADADDEDADVVGAVAVQAPRRLGEQLPVEEKLRLSSVLASAPSQMPRSVKVQLPG